MGCGRRGVRRRATSANPPPSASHASVLGVLNEILESPFWAQLCRYAADLTSTRTPPGVVRSQAAQPSRTPSAGMPRAVATMNSASTPRSVLSRRSDLLQPQKSATVAPTGRPAAVNDSAPVFRDALILARLSTPCPHPVTGSRKACR